MDRRLTDQNFDLIAKIVYNRTDGINRYIEPDSIEDRALRFTIEQKDCDLILLLEQVICSEKHDG